MIFVYTAYTVVEVKSWKLIDDVYIYKSFYYNQQGNNLSIYALLYTYTVNILNKKRW